MAGRGDRFAGQGTLQKSNLVVEIIKRHKHPDLFHPFAHRLIAAIPPRQHLNTPVAFMQALKGCVKALAKAESASIAGEQHDNA